MLKRFFKRVRLNFRKSPSDRKATQSYQNYHKQIKQMFGRIQFLQDIKYINKTKRK